MAIGFLMDYRAYDRAAIKFRGVEADINFNISDYDDDIKQVSVGVLCSLTLSYLWLNLVCCFRQPRVYYYRIDWFLQMSHFSKDEFVHILRRQSTGFSRGSSKYRGVTLHKCGRWEARMGQFLGKK